MWEPKINVCSSSDPLFSPISEVFRGIAVVTARFHHKMSSQQTILKSPDECCENIFNDENGQKPPQFDERPREGKKRGEILDGPGLGSRAGGASGGGAGMGDPGAETSKKKKQKYFRPKRLGTKHQSESTAESKNAKAKHKSTAQSKAQSNVAESKNAKANHESKAQKQSKRRARGPEGQWVRVPEFKSQESSSESTSVKRVMSHEVGKKPQLRSVPCSGMELKKTCGAAKKWKNLFGLEKHTWLEKTGAVGRTISWEET